MEHSVEEVECEICGSDKPFQLPDEIVRAAKSGELILFLGAGISTENPHVTPSGTFYDTIISQLRDPNSDATSFPEIMEVYERENSRKALIEQIFVRFKDVRSFRNSVFHSTNFFNELATMPYVDTIFTTNWDTNLEDYCSATPFISGEDVALWNVADRKVLKLHGSISNLGSLVATSSDYEKNFENFSKGFLGGFLRTALATKTVVFIGYSLRDWNILQLYRDLVQDLGIATPNAFKVSPNAKEDEKLRTIKPIPTSGIHFLRVLKERMLDEGYLPDSVYDQAADMLDLVAELDPRLVDEPIGADKYPNIIYAWVYNDGLRDALDRILRFRGSGYYSDCRVVERRLHSYDHLIDNALEGGFIFDAAYLMGYWDGMSVLLRSDHLAGREAEGGGNREHLIPIFQYDTDGEIGNITQLEEYLESTKGIDDEATRYSQERVKNLPPGFVLNHSGELPPQIFPD